MNQMCCSQCDEPLRVGALSCPKCGEPVPPDTTKKVGPIVALFGVLFLALGPFFPWLDYGAKTVSGVEETRKQALILVGVAVFSAMFAISAMTGKKFTGLRGNIIAGVVAIGLSVYFYVEESYLVSGEPGDPRFGTGMYFSLAGAGLIFVGGLLTRSPKGG